VIRAFAIGTIVFLGLAASANAEDPNAVEGLYSNNAPDGGMALEADVTHLEGDKYSVSLSTVVPIRDNIPGCGGGIDGEVTLAGRTGVMSVPNEGYDPNATGLGNKPLCEIRLTFDEDFKLVIEEMGGCTYYHGASCEFSGELIHDAAGI